MRFSGTLYRSVPLACQADVLNPPMAGPSGRYNRAGERVLYTSPSAAWSMTAVAAYMQQDGIPRICVPLQADQLWLFDPRDTDAAAALGVDPAWSQASWQGALADGRMPPSWQIADAARRAGADGIIDPSRQIAGGWHVTLVRWDNVRVAGPGVLLPQ